MLYFSGDWKPEHPKHCSTSAHTFVYGGRPCLQFPCLHLCSNVQLKVPPESPNLDPKIADNCVKLKVTDKILSSGSQQKKNAQYACRGYVEYCNPTTDLEFCISPQDLGLLQECQVECALLELCYWPHSVWWAKGKEVKINPKFSNPTLLYLVNS